MKPWRWVLCDGISDFLGLERKIKLASLLGLNTKCCPPSLDILRFGRHQGHVLGFPNLQNSEPNKPPFFTCLKYPGITTEDKPRHPSYAQFSVSAAILGHLASLPMSWAACSPLYSHFLCAPEPERVFGDSSHCFGLETLA